MADNRFSALNSDPRYRLPNKKESRTAVDPRFKTLFTDQEFRKKATVDRYGRKIKPDSNKKDLEKLYRLDAADQPKAKLKSGKKQDREVPGSSEEESGTEDDVEDVEAEEDDSEDELVEKRDPMRDGFSESESEEESEESDSEAELLDDTAGVEQTEDVPMGEVSRRIAAVNLDWDNIRAADLMAVAASFAPTGGKIENVTIYPSEFGREKLQREETEGPPREIFASSQKVTAEAENDDDDESSEDDEKIKKKLLETQASAGDEFDTAALRAYQLERLKYYYAVISCSDGPTAKALYDAMDGREYLSTANFFDLRFVPDETSFDDDAPHDECNQLPSGYRPNEFRTEALTHSKVRLTWDDDDATRKEVQKRAFSRAEMEENDLQAYIGSDDSDADSISSRISTAADRKAKKKDAQRQKMRAALGLGDEPTKSSKSAKDEPVGDMQITFTSGLANADGGEKAFGGKKSVFENEPQDEESTRQRYIRKEKERKQARKERSKAARAGTTTAGSAETSDHEEAAPALPAEKDTPEEEDPFADPFFTDPAASTAAATKAARKAAKAEERAAREKTDAEASSRKAELSLLMQGENGEGEGVRHFDMREIEKAEKAARRKKGKFGKKPKGLEEVEKDDFQVEVEDPRFGKVFESHEYAIDPTNPRFKGTVGMKTLLEEGRKKRKFEDGDGEEGKKKGKRAVGGEVDVDDVKSLVARLKDKSQKKKR
ncbi:pre-rRNA-processing protein ESF1 [Zymoseptoria brevis]|uniref:Pre-rRNA-processing protein ESF1 n=1 Tax=Zymoseptoria brevis TaxID=1047168 RepID=A0A0F4GBF4_9PEZI|nr:pre-rRNA-processing protein ESF1 [Zymoseptoria brevis]